MEKDVNVKNDEITISVYKRGANHDVLGFIFRFMSPLLRKNVQNCAFKNVNGTRILIMM